MKVRINKSYNKIIIYKGNLNQKYFIMMGLNMNLIILMMIILKVKNNFL